MKKWTNLLALALLLFCFSCNEMDKYYDNERHSSSVSVGNAWDYLSSRGNFTCFLTGVKEAGYESLVSGTGLATIFAPTDDAFRKYFKRHGHDDADSVTLDELKKWVEDMNPTELKNMITYHLLYYGFTSGQFMAYNPDGVTASQDNTAGTYHKYRTKSRDTIEVVSDPTDGLQKKVFHAEKCIPVFTSNAFSRVGASAATDYQTLYGSFGENLWNEAASDEQGNYFRVSNAAVKEYNIITDNGYLYILDDVVEPLKTIHQVLKANENYSMFINAYDRFADFIYDAEISQTYGNGGRDTLFRFEHIDLLNIAQEWVTSDWSQYNMVLYNTVYAPNNAIMTAFFNDYWANYYSSLDKVNIKPLAALLTDQIEGSNISTVIANDKEQMFGRKPVFPSNIQHNEAGTFFTNTSVGWDKIDSSIYCSNGILYEVNDLVAIPTVFSYVTAPAFLDPAYNMFLLLMYKSGFDSYTSENVTFHAFYPDDAIISNTETFSGSRFQYVKNSNKAGDEDVSYQEGDEIFSVSASLASNIVRNHFCDNVIEVRGGDEKIYHTTYGTFNYLYRKGDKLYSPSLYNDLVGRLGESQVTGENDNASEREITCEDITEQLPAKVNVRNGRVYRLSGGNHASAFVAPPSSELYTFFVKNEDTYKIDKNRLPHELIDEGPSEATFYSRFIEEQDTLAVVKTMQEESVGSKLPRFILFAFTTEATMNAIMAGVIDDSQTTAKIAYSSNLYVSVPRSRLADYPFPNDGKGIRELQTFKKKTAADGGGYTSLKIRDDGDHLTVIDPTGREVRVKNSFPYIYPDGAIYVLEDYLDFGEYNTKENIN